MKKVRLYCSLFWLVFSVVTCFEASRLSMGESNQPGPGFFPFFLGVAMGILSLISLLRCVQKSEPRKPFIPTEPLRWWNIVIILVALVAYALTLQKIGFMINTFLFIAFLLKIVEPQPWKTALLGGLIVSIASDLVFNVILNAQIPSGILGF